MNTSAVFGFVNSLLKLLNEKTPEYLVVSFDAKGPTFRHEKFKDYKMTRPPMPKELEPQFKIIKDILNAFGIKVLEEKGIEADDTIGTIALRAKAKGFEVIIFSEDKDFLQLEEVKVFNPRSFDFMTAKKKLGIPAGYVPDFLALTGDKIDNVPGVPGIGPKTAERLVNQFGKIKDLYENIEKLDNEKLKRLLLDFKDQVILARELTELKTDADVEMDLESLKISKFDTETLIPIFKELEFFSIIKKLAGEGVYKVRISQIKPEDKKTKTYQFSDNWKEILKVLKDRVSLFIYEPYFAVSPKEGKAFIFKDEIERLGSLLSGTKPQKITTDSKSLFLKFNARENIFDLSLASYLLKPGTINHSIDNLAIEWLNQPLSELDTGKGRHKKDIEELPVDSIVNWLGERADCGHRLFNVLNAELKAKNLFSLFEEVELPLAHALAEMERAGVLIDRAYFMNQSKKLSKALAKIESRVYELAGEIFNLRSPAQLAHILFDKLGLPKSRRTKTGYSTDQDVLTELSKDYELPRKLLEYRSLFKLKSTYVDALLELADIHNRIHTTWQQTVTTTGRLSSTNPNLQNIPKREIRKGFIAPEGWYIMAADYSQIELRILASISGDLVLKDAFEKGEDIHTKTASLVFNIPKSKITAAERNTAKMVNFGIIYGMGPYGLSQRLGISTNEAETFISNYFLTYPKVKQWIDSSLEKARKNGYVETLLGRKRWLENINADNAHIREFEERVAINAPIQGTAADMIKVAMIRIYNKLKKFKSRLIIQVHDELVLEVAKDEVDEVKKLVKAEMENALPLTVPVVVDVGIGKNWYETH